jgi:hypothetical protein
VLGYSAWRRVDDAVLTGDDEALLASR